MKTFVEIGSCDFDTLNYLSDKGWRGVIVEPIKKYLDNIPQKPNVQYLNYAIDVTNGTREMKIASDEVVESDYTKSGMSSFVREDDSLTESVLVNTITFDDLISFCGITQIDYLKIDVEGYDWVLIKNFPFDKIKPAFIQVEWEHVDSEEMSRYIASQGYHVNYDRTDIYAYYTG